MHEKKVFCGLSNKLIETSEFWEKINLYYFVFLAFHDIIQLKGR